MKSSDQETTFVLYVLHVQESCFYRFNSRELGFANTLGEALLC